MGLIKSLTTIGILIPLVLVSFDFYMSPKKEFKPTSLGITQPKISDTVNLKQHSTLIDKEKGTCEISGWDVGVEDKILVNHYYATPMSSTVLYANYMKYRAWNFFLLHTPNHVIQFMFADLAIACNT